ncbi:IS1634 family transposase [Candidatus Collierbacteria bacterium]|nr:IS1634 family transposase [Candidatus Collierbacteria bacterium]
MKPHYASIRRVKTKSGAVAIQVGQYQGKRFKLLKHLGSAKESTRITELVELASKYIETNSPQLSLNFSPHSEEVLFKRGIQAQKSRLTTAYDYLEKTYQKLGFNQLNSEILKHFCLIRVLEPASKIKSLYLLQKYFSLNYKKTTVFRKLHELISLKEKVVGLAISYAKENLEFDFSLVFYDVTTLYFETHQSDDFRLNGFSKDNKINQPQILVGLMVNHTGFPVYYDIFPGNTFEGHTIIPVITSIKAKYNISRLTVVADAGMLSEENLSALQNNQIDYIVGARIKKLKLDQIKLVAKELNQVDGKVIRRDSVLYDYSSKRAKKDKSDNDKQLQKAEYLITHPAKALKRSSFIASPKNQDLLLNLETIEKYRLLEGVKGYKTNITDIPDQLLINRYKDLWHVEQSFRIAKSDLQARPIYHRKKDSIEYHLLMSLWLFVSLKSLNRKSKLQFKK